jgi:hypothetical protein
MDQSLLIGGFELQVTEESNRDICALVVIISQQLGKQLLGHLVFPKRQNL